MIKSWRTCSLQDKSKRLLEFLKKSKKRVEKKASSLNQMLIGVIPGVKSVVNIVTGSISLPTTKCPNQAGQFCQFQSQRHFWKGDWRPCLGCNMDGCTDLESVRHAMESCDLWTNLLVKDRESRVKCFKHSLSKDHSKAKCTYPVYPCKLCKRKTSSNTAEVISNCSIGDEPPEVSLANPVLFDLASTDNYVMQSYARKHQLHGEPVLLIVSGIRAAETQMETYIYSVPINIGGLTHKFPCYGLDTICSLAEPPEAVSYGKLCLEFGIHMLEVICPRKIYLLISMRQNL